MTSFCLCHRARRFRGNAFTITEMLAVMILLGTVSLVMTRAFRQTTRILYDAPAAENAMRSASAMLVRLRADAWTASDVQLVSRDHVTFHIGDVTHDWQFVPNEGRVVRTVGAETMSWPLGLAANDACWFTHDDGLLIIHSRAGNHDETQIALPSAVRVLTRAGDAK